MQRNGTDWNRRKVMGGIAGAAAIGIAPGLRAAPSGQPVRIGSTLALTGPLAQTAMIHKISGEIYVEHLNKQNGLLGRPVEWVLLDDQSKPEVARSLYEKLITVDKVDLILGPYGTSNILAAIGVAQRYGKVFIQSTLGMPHLMTYDMGIPATPFGSAPAKTYPAKFYDMMAASPTPPKSITVLTSKFPSAQFMSMGVRDMAEQRGIKLALYLEYEFGTRDFGAIAARVKDANSDMLWVGSLGLESNQLLEALKKLDYTPPRHFHLYPASGALAVLPEGKDALSSAFVEEHPPFDKYRDADWIFPQYKERATKAGLPYTFFDSQAAGMFAMWQILDSAVQATKSLDDKKLATWIKGTQIETMNGKARFDGPNNHGDDLQMIRQLQGGKWVVVWPSAFAPPGVKPKLP